jgi:hypothetical protein
MVVNAGQTEGLGDISSHLTAPERETVILFSDAGNTATISTHQRKVITKLERNPLARKVEDLSIGNQPGATFELDADLITFRRSRPQRPGAGQNLAIHRQHPNGD